MDSLLQELIAVDSDVALNFFAENLRETAGSRRLREDEMFYVASVLAHYAQTSRADNTSIPPMAGLSDVFDNFVLQTITASDSELLEIGGSQILLFAGFFRDQMVRRHNVRWYDQIGQSLYERASQHSRNASKRQLFDRLAGTFPEWTGICSNMSRALRENRLLLKFN
jgi:hypothetical protein